MSKILIVDDRQDKRDGLKDMLTLLQHDTPLEAENGVEGLAIARREIPALILLDIDMPVMDGFEFLEHMRKDAAIQDIPVVVISGSINDDKLIRCIERGAADYLTYPAALPLLRARINTLIDRRQRQLEAKDFQQRLEKLYFDTTKAERRANELLKSIFPEQLLKKLHAKDDLKPERIENVAVLFSDVVGFTAYSHDHSPEEVVEKLQELVTTFEDVAERNGIEKIKTIGDAFMAAGGLFDDDPDVAFRTVKCGMEMIAAANQLPMKWQVRIGIHSGPVVAGKIGKKKYSYDIWGDTVNTASRVEHEGTPGFVVVSTPVWDKIASRCRRDGASYGVIKIKGKPDMELFKVKEIIDPST